MDRGLVEELKRVVKWNSDLEKSCLKFSKIITETELQKIKVKWVIKSTLSFAFSMPTFYTKFLP